MDISTEKSISRNQKKAKQTKENTIEAVQLDEVPASTPQSNSEQVELTENEQVELTKDEHTELTEEVQTESTEEVQTELTEEVQDVYKAVLVKAKSLRGFWRCGLFWSNEGSYTAVINDLNNIPVGANGMPFISNIQLERLQNEPMLLVIPVHI